MVRRWRCRSGAHPARVDRFVVEARTQWTSRADHVAWPDDALGHEVVFYFFFDIGSSAQGRDDSSALDLCRQALPTRHPPHAACCVFDSRIRARRPARFATRSRQTTTDPQSPRPAQRKPAVRRRRDAPDAPPRQACRRWHRSPRKHPSNRTVRRFSVKRR
jgi:hypothetical protein